MKTLEEKTASQKKSYKKPEVVSAKIYERLALTCSYGKGSQVTSPPCQTGKLKSV